ncbi:MAG TPA: amidohydrolase family protein [Firmicutes bacterium]|nr:amidohydrolase family protein [Bacillota bacterium]
MKYDLVIKGCHVVDPENRLDGPACVGIKQGKVVEVAPDLDGSDAMRVLRFPGKLLIPGMIDIHVHCSSWLGGSLGFGMLAKAGVTTAVDLAGPVTDVIENMKTRGSGINMAVLNAVHPGNTVSSDNPSFAELQDMVKKSLEAGALGVKVLGGHYPLTPEATRNVIRAANEQRAYVAFHAGSKKNGSNIRGAMDAIEFSEGRPFHLAHVNAYCRGLVLGDPIVEVIQLLEALERNPQIISEFHLAIINGTSGKCINGEPESHITRTALKMGGYPPTEEGLKSAFIGGWGYCTGENIDGENVYLTGREALEYWESRGGDCTVGFPVNNRTTAFLCATGRDSEGKFVIDALGTDGGGIPRNFLLKFGLLLVEWGSWTLSEFVERTSRAPAQMLGLVNKGHLSPGADADITIADLEKRQAVATIVGGEVVCSNGVVTGRGGTILCTERGVTACKERGIPYQVVDLGQSMLYRRENRF